MISEYYKLQIFYKFTNTGNLLRQSLRAIAKGLWRGDEQNNIWLLRFDYFLVIVSCVLLLILFYNNVE